MAAPAETRMLRPADLIALGYSEKDAGHILHLLSDKELLEYYLHTGAKRGCSPLTRVSEGYPAAVRMALGLESPGCLWAKGDKALLQNRKIALVGSELLTDAMREEMHKFWGKDILITSNYGMSELMGPGVSGECTELCGMHINEDFFIPEIIDPVTGEVLPEGEQGELVITCIKKEGIPLIRYRTRDITRLFYDKCRCGRTFCRMENLSGRSDDMLKIRGVNVFPSQIEEVILGIEELGPHYEILLERDGYLDKMTIKVELATITDSFSTLEKISSTLKGRLRTILGLDAKVMLESPNTLQRFEGKAKRVKDLRNIK